MVMGIRYRSRDEKTPVVRLVNVEDVKMSGSYRLAMRFRSRPSSSTSIASVAGWMKFWFCRARFLVLLVRLLEVNPLEPWWIPLTMGTPPGGADEEPTGGDEASSIIIKPWRRFDPTVIGMGISG